MANNIQSSKPDPTFKHNCVLGSNGEILYDCPIEIRSRADLCNYGITWNDCRTLNFNGSDRVTVYYFQTTNRELAEQHWTWLDSEHSRAYAANRCQVKGKRKALIRCPDTNSCANCPFGRKPEDRRPNTISWDGLVEAGGESGAALTTEDIVFSEIRRDEMLALMETEDKRIAEATQMKELGFSVEAMAIHLKVSEPRIYQFLARAKAIIRDYQSNNG